VAPTLRREHGGPGETCLVLAGAGASGSGGAVPVPAGSAAPPAAAPVRHCTHGRLHLASASLAPDGSALALQVQPLDGWTELWRLDAAGRLQVLPPASDAPGLGAVEAAGWLPARDGAQLLVAREAEAGGRSLRRFEVYAADLAQPLRWAGDPALLGAFQRAADPGWRGLSTLAR
jgi:hypothetical protein